LGNGNGTFQDQQTVASSARELDVAVSDLNGDGKPAIVVASTGALGLLSILPGNGNGTFLPQQTMATGARPSPVVTSDLNGDGRPDLITTNFGDGTVSIFLSNAAYSFTGQVYTVVPNLDSIPGTSAVDQITLARDPDGQHIDWTLGGTTAQLLVSSDPIAAIQGYLHNGYNSGAWNGTPTASTGVITSAAAQANPNHTTAIGYADSADGQGVNTMTNTIELTYTLYGDANLDHQVNSADLQILLAFLNRPGNWDQGDFNYDAQVNSADLQALLFTLNTSLGSQATPLAVAAAPVGPAAASAPSSAGDPSSQRMPAINTTGSTTTPIHHPHPAKISARKRR
jgi:hypothetical protein